MIATVIRRVGIATTARTMFSLSWPHGLVLGGFGFADREPEMAVGRAGCEVQD